MQQEEREEQWQCEHRVGKTMLVHRAAAPCAPGPAYLCWGLITWAVLTSEHSVWLMGPLCPHSGLCSEKQQAPPKVSNRLAVEKQSFSVFQLRSSVEKQSSFLQIWLSDSGPDFYFKPTLITRRQLFLTHLCNFQYSGVFKVLVSSLRVGLFRTLFLFLYLDVFS